MNIEINRFLNILLTFTFIYIFFKTVLIVQFIIKKNRSGIIVSNKKFTTD